MTERLYIAAVAALGQQDAASAVLQVEVDDHRVREALQRLESLRPAGPQPSVTVAEDAPQRPQQSPVETALTSAREAIGADRKPEAEALLDGIVFTVETESLRMQRGRLYLELRALEKAIADCRAEWDRNADNDYAGMGLALALAKTGAHTEAMDLWRRCHRGRPGHELREFRGGAGRHRAGGSRVNRAPRV